MTRYIMVVTMVFVFITTNAYLVQDVSGRDFFKRYCTPCHGENDVRSGTVVYHSKETIMLRYKNKPRILLEKLRNIDKYSISNEMIKAVHQIQDDRVLQLIVEYVSQTDLPGPDKGKIKGL